MQTDPKNPNWWSQRTNLEKGLAFICVTCSLAMIALVISLVCLMNYDGKANPNESTKSSSLGGNFAKVLPSNNENKHEICLTPTCIHAASKMIEQMDLTVKPCDDFFSFACGNYVKDAQIPDDKTDIGATSLIEDKLQGQLKNILSEAIEENEAAPFKLAKNLYKACMNKTLIEERNIKPLVEIIDSFGGWPVVKGDSWDESKWNWTKTTEGFRKLGYSTDYILDFSIETDPKNSTKRIIDVDQTSLGMSREYLIKGINDTVVQAYFSYMVDMAVLYGAEKTKAQSEMRESLEFEFALANISLPQEERRDTNVQYNPFSIKDLQVKYPYLNWLDYINVILPKNVRIDENEIIIVCVPTFFDQLGKLLEKTPKRTIANYMMWRITAYSTLFMNEKFRQRQLKFSTAISGKLEQEPRWKECVDVASGRLGIAVGALYVRKYFKEDSKAAALDMVNRIKVEFGEILKTISWMDKTTRKSALVKLEKMSAHIGYPEELMFDKNIIDYYESVTLDENKYLESVLKLNVFASDRIFGKLREVVNKTDWKDHANPAIVNAFYAAIENSIQFPAGILQGQFFGVDKPKYLNYGGIGFVIGHEVVHGYDDQGRQFDLDGNLVDWWQEETKIAFLEKAKCIIEQYGNYTDENVNLKLNGINTQGENIADNGGIKESYLAYKKLVQDNGIEPRLPGLSDYSPEQLFWLSAAQTWCSVTRPEAMKMLITTNEHAPDKFRVLGPLSNMRDFAVDYNCPDGSVMNPTKKCEMW